jgi:hypothetical protein
MIFKLKRLQNADISSVKMVFTSPPSLVNRLEASNANPSWVRVIIAFASRQDSFMRNFDENPFNVKQIFESLIIKLR